MFCWKWIKEDFWRIILKRWPFHNQNIIAYIKAVHNCSLIYHFDLFLSNYIAHHSSSLSHSCILPKDLSAFTTYVTRYIASSTVNQLDHDGHVHEKRCHILTGLTRDFSIQASHPFYSVFWQVCQSMPVMLWRMSILNLAESPPPSLRHRLRVGRHTSEHFSTR